MTPQTDPPQRADLPAPDELFAIVYVSTAAQAMTLPALQSLLHKAQQRNATEGVTGVLLYADGSFMQYLEGPPCGLARVYERIKADATHYGLIDLVRAPVATRVFGEWSMAFRLAGAFGRASAQQQDALLTQRLAQPGQPGSTARILLSTFWTEGRAAVAPALQAHASARLQQGQSGRRKTGGRAR